MQFIHLSDTHFLRDYHDNHDIFRQVYLDMTPSITQLQTLLQTIQSPIDFVLHTGDLVHEGTREDYEAFLLGLKDCFGEIPLFVTPGNHDRKGLYPVFAPELGEEDLFFQVHRYGELNIVSFDSTDSAVPSGAIGEETCRRLKAYFDQYPNTPTILMTHHHFLAEQFPLTPTTRPDAFGELLQAQQNIIVALFTGHAHHHYAGTLYGVPYYTVDSLSFSAENILGGLRIEERSGIHLCTYEGGKLTVEQIGGKTVTRILGEVER